MKVGGSASVESAPRIKDAAKIATFIHAAREAARGVRGKRRKGDGWISSLGGRGFRRA